MEFPISDDVFLESMKAGRAYAGDPVWLKGEVELSASVPGIVALGLAPMNQKDAVQKTSMQELCSVPMGGILAVMDRDTEPRPMSFRVGAVQKGWRICVIVDGEPAAEYVTTEAGAFECSFSVKPLRPVSFARVEMYNENGRCILLTNPIYLVRIAEYAGELPASRCYGGLECFARPWTGEITLPKGIEEIRGTKILHIGDTDSTWYPYFIRLIEVVKPDIILHTGDTSDEVKVGRIPGTRHEYLTKVRVLLEAMDKSGARLIFTSGNNDLPQELHKMVPRMEIYPANSVLTLDGVECRVGHRVMDMTFDKDWTFYGHGLTGEVWHYEDNREGQPCRFNTSWGSFVYCMSEGKFFHLPLPKLT